MLTVSVVKCTREKNSLKHLQHQLDSANKALDKYKDSVYPIIDSLNRRDLKLLDSINTINQDYSVLLAKKQKLEVADSLQKEEIRKGIKKFGAPSVNQFQSVLAGFYGNQAFDNLDLTEKRLSNQMKVSSSWMGVTIQQDTLISTYKIVVPKIIDQAKPNFWQKFKEWIIAFILGGAVGVISI